LPSLLAASNHTSSKCNPSIGFPFPRFPQHVRYFSSLEVANDNNNNNDSNNTKEDPGRQVVPNTNPDDSELNDDSMIMNSEPTTMDRSKIRTLRYNILRNCATPNKESAHQAQKYLNELMSESIRVGRPLANIQLYNNCLNAWAKCGLKTAFRKATALLETMHEQHQAHPQCCPSPNTISYNCVLDACVRSSASGHTEAADKADELIRAMEQRSSSNPDGDIHPETRSYNAVILAHSYQAPIKYGAATAAEDWLRYLSKVNTQGGVGPNTLTFNYVLKAWKASPEDKGADRALEMLHLMIKLNREGHHEQVAPGERSFSTVIGAFAERNRPEEAEEVLKLALSYFLDDDFVQYYSEKLVDMRPCFNGAINGWAKSTESNAPERADSLLRDMKALGQETDLLITEPDIFSHTSCMQTLANSGRPDAPEILESRLYALMEENSANHGEGPLPGPPTFDCVIRTWFRSNKPQKAERMESLLNTQIELAQRRNEKSLLPPSRTVNLCINAWCRAGEAKTKAIHLLNRMEAIGRIDSESFIPLIDTLLEESRNKNDNDSAEAAAVVLEKLNAQIKYRGSIRWPSDPDFLHSKVYSALRQAGTGKAADKAYSLLSLQEGATLKKARPSVKSYSIVIHALANDPNPDRTKKALDIFDHLIRLHHDRDSKIQADQYAFHAILTLLANTSERWAADRARALLGEMTEMYLETNSKILMPNSMCYDRSIQAMARCGDWGSVNEAAVMLKDFVNDFRNARAPGLPSEAAFNAVLKYCSLIEGDEAESLAQELLALREDLKNKGHLITYP